MNNNKIELLAPAGDLLKAKIAYLYGADAVYVGGKNFSLRARASNFTLDDLKELCLFKNNLQKKLYVTLNIIPHMSDLFGLTEYIKALDEMGVDAVIVSSTYILKKVVEISKNMEAHVSTQKSVLNLASIEYYKRLGATRVVLARELSINEIEELALNSPLELEVFIHGGMCSSFSGHCVLSNHMTNRDANRGGCAHSCRWNYSLVKNGEELPNIYNIAAKDLMAVPFIPKLIDLNISSLKIEGRLKSAYYLACVIRSYRMLIDKYYNVENLVEKDFDEVYNEVKKCENRETSIGFLNGIPTVNEQLYDNHTEIPTQEFIAFILEKPVDGWCIIEQRNNFKIGEEVEIITPTNTYQWVIGEMKDLLTDEKIEIAPHAQQKILLKMPFDVEYGDMIRKIKK